MDELLSVLVDEGLGNAGYLVDLGDGRALAVDPSADLRALRERAHRLGLTVAFVAETHLHADFLSGACRLAASEGATVLAPRAGGRFFEHRGLEDGDEVDLGGLRLRALHTPGHTDEHCAYLLLDGARALGVFSGGSLLVDGVARTDLVDPDRTTELARRQYQSVRGLLSLPDETALWPTHGAGSFCAAPSGGDRTSTIGRERATGKLARAVDEDSFVTGLVTSLGSFPPYFLRLGELNRRGLILGEERLAVLDVHEASRLRAAGATVVDTRCMERFAAAHIPGSLSVELRPQFATWLGWLAPPDRPIVVVRDSDQDVEEISWQAAKVGVRLGGELLGGVEAWAAAGKPLSTTPLRRVEEVAAHQLVDVREANEFARGHVAGAHHAPLGDVVMADLPASADVLMCGHGERGMTAASLLEAAGRNRVSVLVGGPEDWSRAHGVPVATGE